MAAVAAEGKRHQSEETGLDAIRVLEELRRIAFSDVRRLFDDDGRLRDIHTLNAEDAACVAAVEVLGPLNVEWFIGLGFVLRSV